MKLLEIIFLFYIMKLLENLSYYLYGMIIKLIVGYKNL